MNRPFVVDERVCVYLNTRTGVARRLGTVELPGVKQSAEKNTVVWVCLDQDVEFDGETNTRMWVHVQQCRRLVRKERRQWTLTGRQNEIYANGPSLAVGETVRVIEIRKK